MIQADDQGQFTIRLPVDVVVTLSTVITAVKGSYPTPPVSTSFPIPYSENFNPNGFSEAFNFADQSGAFENFHNASSTDGHKWTLRQVIKAKDRSYFFPIRIIRVMCFFRIIAKFVSFNTVLMVVKGILD